jgi:L-lactate dehydrogenase complex protein LldF
VSAAAGPRDFPAAAKRALGDAALQQALGNIPAGFQEKRKNAIARLPEWDALVDAATGIKNHTLEHLDFYLEAFEAKVAAQGGQVHWCRDGGEARAAVLAICRGAKAKRILKSKSMIAEEIALNAALEEDGLDVVETDLGEYVLQLRAEQPSHIIAPIIHLNRDQIADSFLSAHKKYGKSKRLDSARELLNEAREILREKFITGDVGVTGANLLVAETGSAVIVTNEGNADLAVTLPRVHIVIASIEKLVPTVPEAWTILRLLARSATGQDITAYTTFVGGPRRASDADGPGAFHVVLLDNRRAEMLGSGFRDMLRCIRCAACMNHCPVYAAVGGHAYNSVYPGPMGAVLTPWFGGIGNAAHLPNASTLCGRCENVCPMRIPIPKMLRLWREKEDAAKLSSRRGRIALGLWAWAAKHPFAYRLGARIAARALRRLSGGRGRIARLPFGSAWTDSRDFPAGQGDTFQSLYARRGR